MVGQISFDCVYGKINYSVLSYFKIMTLLLENY